MTALKRVLPVSVMGLALTALAPPAVGYGQQLSLKEEQAFVAAIDRVAPSVVQIETFGTDQRAEGELAAGGPTTGTILTSDGWIISSTFSFRGDPATILVTLPDGQRQTAEIVARDFSRELALLRVAANDLPVPEFAPQAEVSVGQWTLAIGKTYDPLNVSQSVGIVSALGRAYDKAIQVDAKVSPLNYGGPMIDLQGRVVGILAPIAPGAFLDGDSSQIYDSGIGFAVPVEDILARLERLQSGEDIRSGLLGIVTSTENELAGPVKIVGAAPGSPAAKAGVQSGDILVRAEDRPVSLLAHLRHALGPADAGQPFEFTIQRKDQQLQLSCILTDEIPVYFRRYLGLRLKPEIADPVKLIVQSVQPDSPAKRAGIPAGATITQVANIKAPDKQELRQIVSVAELDSTIAMHWTAENGDSASAELTPELWPQTIPESLPVVSSAVDQTLESEITKLAIGDFSNSCYVVVPPATDGRELGLLLLLPRPGESDQAKTLELWKTFTRDYGWLVAVIDSANPKAWSREELELVGRVVGQIGKTYQLDANRMVVGGVGVGGRVALLAAASQPDRFSGVLTIGTKIGRIAMQQRNAPMRSLDFLLIGDEKELKQPVEALQESGYIATTVNGSAIEPSKWESFPNEPIQRWLEGLGRY